MKNKDQQMGLKATEGRVCSLTKMMDVSVV